MLRLEEIINFIMFSEMDGATSASYVEPMKTKRSSL